MDRKLAIAVAAALTTSTADAAIYPTTLTSVELFLPQGSGPANISSSTATWMYDSVTGLLSQSAGTFNVRVPFAPAVTFYRESITGLVIGNGGTATATTFNCAEGDYGAFVGGHLCGYYGFGANSVNESTVTWGPGTATSRTIGGDDVAAGAMRSIAIYDNFTTASWVGTTLVMTNRACNPLHPGSANGCATLGGFNAGYRWTLQTGAAIPIPAAAWMFGGALAGLGMLRRRQATA